MARKFRNLVSKKRIQKIKKAYLWMTKRDAAKKVTNP